MSEVIIGQLQDAVVALDPDKAKQVAKNGIEADLDPLYMINQGIRSALELMGERFSSGDLFLPELTP